MHSKCSDCCECDFETEEIDIHPQDSNLNDKKYLFILYIIKKWIKHQISNL